MNYTIRLKKSEGLLVWILNHVKNKFTSVYDKTIGRFPIFQKHPLLKYSSIPLFIALFVGLRYVIKLVVGELAAWSSGFLEESSGLEISEKTIVISIAVVVIVMRVALRFWSQRKEKTNAN